MELSRTDSHNTNSTPNQKQDDGVHNPVPASHGLVIREDVLDCLSRNRERFRVYLTETYLILQHLKRHHVERFAIEDLFGVQTLRHRKQGQPGHNGASNTTAFVCFYLYPKTKKAGLMSQVKLREKITLVFEFKKDGKSYAQNLDLATLWKNSTIELLAEKYPKWQVMNPERQTRRNILVDGSEWNQGPNVSNDEMDSGTEIGQGEVKMPLSGQISHVRRYTVILNPKSGQGKTLEIFRDKVAPILRESNVKMEVLVTQHPGHARNMMSSADLSEVDGLITIGGDGILYEVVNGLRSRGDTSRISKIPIGIIAGGSGNGLARSIADYCGEAQDYLKNPVLSSTLAAARGKDLPVNLTEVDLDGDKIYSFLSIGWGLLADIDVESEVLRALGEPRFTIWSFYRLIKLRTYKAKLTYTPVKINEEGLLVEEEQVVLDSEFVCIYATCQSYIGSDLIFAPTALRNDGLLHLVYMTGDIGRARATQFLISIDKGSHIDVEGVKYVTVKQFTLESDDVIPGNVTIDGEKVCGKKLTARISSTPLNVMSL